MTPASAAWIPVDGATPATRRWRECWPYRVRLDAIQAEEHACGDEVRDEEAGLERASIQENRQGPRRKEIVHHAQRRDEHAKTDRDPSPSTERMPRVNATSVAVGIAHP